MLLEALRDFEWYNEAADVAFGERRASFSLKHGTTMLILFFSI